MKVSASLLAIALGLVRAAPVPDFEIEKRSTVQGFDISDYQTSVNFAAAYSSGARFVIIKVRQSNHFSFLYNLG